MTEPNPGDEARPIIVSGQEVLVNQLLPAQAILVMRLVRDLRKSANAEDVDRMAIVNSTAKILDIIESALVREADWDYLEELIISRKLDLTELVSIVTVFKDEAVQEKPKVRRGRPRKQA